MKLAEVKRRLKAIEQKKKKGKVMAFVNIDHELDAQINSINKSIHMIRFWL